MKYETLVPDPSAPRRKDTLVVVVVTLKDLSESAQSRGWASDADVFRGHRLTALMWGRKREQ